MATVAPGRNVHSEKREKCFCTQAPFFRKDQREHLSLLHIFLFSNMTLKSCKTIMLQLSEGT